MASSKEKNGGAYVALLRGINVGGKNKLPMKNLATLFEEAGCTDVVTYIQSGNVVFHADAAAYDRIPEQITGAIAKRFGLKVPIVTRTAREMKAVVERNPFLKDGADADTLHVGFLSDEPSNAQVKSLDPDRSPPDTFAMRGREVYFQFPEGMARSKLTTDYFDRRLGTVMTVRNWRTVLKLIDLLNVT